MTQLTRKALKGAGLSPKTAGSRRQFEQELVFGNTSDNKSLKSLWNMKCKNLSKNSRTESRISEEHIPPELEKGNIHLSRERTHYSETEIHLLRRARLLSKTIPPVFVFTLFYWQQCISLFVRKHNSCRINTLLNIINLQYIQKGLFCHEHCCEATAPSSCPTHTVPKEPEVTPASFALPIWRSGDFLNGEQPVRAGGDGSVLDSVPLHSFSSSLPGVRSRLAIFVLKYIFFIF